MPYKRGYKRGRRTASRRTTRKAKIAVRGRGRKAVLAPSRSSNANSALINTVKRIMNAGEEKKNVCFVQTFANVPNITTTTSSLNGVYQVLTPSNSTYGYNIAQGVNNAQRIGNRVRTHKLVCNYTITPKGYNATSNPNPQPQIVIIYFFKSKINPAGDITATQLTQQFFENGPTMTGLSGYLMDLNRKICPDTFTYLTHRVHKIGYAKNDQTGSMPSYAAQANNDFKLFVNGKVDLTKYCPKLIRWDDNNLVNNDWIYCVHQTLNVFDAPAASTIYPVSISYDTYFTYTDA